MRNVQVSENRSALWEVLSWLFGVIVVAIGIINIFWGNDPGFGVFVVLLSLIYFPPAAMLFTRMTRLPIPLFAKIILGLFITWAALGVGELFEKIDLMTKSF